MCGIFGYAGSREAAPIVRDGLIQLEYRGYDSAGIAADKVVKGVGTISDLDLSPLHGNVAIGHTRWATNGAVTYVNAHPHVVGSVAVVHNGVVTNHESLRDGASFVSDTDTEVIAYLINRDLAFGFVESCRRAFRAIDGDYAILAKYGDTIVGSRRELPLVVGVRDDGVLFSSDVRPLSDTNVMYLRNSDIVVADPSGLKVYDSSGGEVHRGTVRFSADPLVIPSDQHYMLREIVDQASVVRATMSQDRSMVHPIRDCLNGATIVACGSSYHAGLVGKYLLARCGIHVDVAMASEFRNFVAPELVLAISQSGETADVLSAIKGTGAIGITNVRESRLATACDDVLLLAAGSEYCVLSTKTYTAQVALFALIADPECDLEPLVSDIYNLTSKSFRDRVGVIARLLSDHDHVYIIGRGALYPTALEGALKIKEASYIHAEGFASGELKHGNIALISEGTPVIALGHDDPAIDQVKSRGAMVIGVSNERHPGFDHWIKVPNSFDPITHIIPMQLLAYELALLRGCNPDRPRNLAKCVTVP
jgi:glucosamine--fructose-6-phosphate aminotransferase (isomerizing)